MSWQVWADRAKGSHVQAVDVANRRIVSLRYESCLVVIVQAAAEK